MKAKNLIPLIAFIFLSVNIYAQTDVKGVSIAEDTLAPHPSAMLEVRSINKGVLLPEWTTTKRHSMTSVLTAADEGLTIFVNDEDPDKKGFWYWVWISSSSSGEWRKLIIKRKTTYPPGSIIMYKGSVSNFDVNGIGITDDLEGWALCDGLNGRPNLTSKFIVGGKNDVADYNTLNETGGSNTITITVPNLPAHNHKYNATVKNNVTFDHDHTFTQGGSHSHQIKSIGDEDGGAGLTHVKESKKKKKSGKNGTLYTTYNTSDVSLGTANPECVNLAPTTPTGTSSAVNKDNRPAYYVVAYIICIKAGESYNSNYNVPAYNE